MTTRTNFRTVATLAAALLTLTACGGDDTNGAAPSTDAPVTTPVDGSGSEATTADAAGGATVTISRSRFSETEIRVAPGTTVTFVNTDAFAHTVTSRDGSPVEFDSGELGLDETFEFTFDEPGEYAYFCQIHPTMRAVVIVG